MYAASYANFQQAKQTLTEIPAANGLQACVDCGACQAQCSRRVQISRRLQELKTIFA
jgi:heterodisulfide reductase subunit C